MARLRAAPRRRGEPRRRARPMLHLQRAALDGANSSAAAALTHLSRSTMSRAIRIGRVLMPLAVSGAGQRPAHRPAAKMKTLQPLDEKG